MWGIVTKKIGRVAVKELGKSGALLFTRSLALIISTKPTFYAPPNSSKIIQTRSGKIKNRDCGLSK